MFLQFNRVDLKVSLLLLILINLCLIASVFVIMINFLWALNYYQPKYITFMKFMSGDTLVQSSKTILLQNLMILLT